MTLVDRRRAPEVGVDGAHGSQSRVVQDRLVACRQRLRRVLVVDDNRDTADALGTLIGSRGHAVAVAYDAKDAYARGGWFEPDVVLLDIEMPEEDGLQLAPRIRQQPWGRAALLVAVTGLSRPEDRRATAAAGFDVHLVKPVDFDALGRLLEAADDGRGGSREPGQA